MICSYVAKSVIIVSCHTPTTQSVINTFPMDLAMAAEEQHKKKRTENPEAELRQICAPDGLQRLRRALALLLVAGSRSHSSDEQASTPANPGATGDER